MAQADTAPEPPAPYATLGRRCAAGTLDLVPTLIVVVPLTAWLGTTGFVLGVILSCAVFAVQEARDGRSLGKRLVGIRVLHLDGTRCTTLGAVLRNAFRVIDAFPGIYLIAVTSIAGSRRRQRLGDQAAGTSVYRA